MNIISACIDGCPQTTLAFHRAHKERLQRFASAAARHSGEDVRQADVAQIRMLEKYLMPVQPVAAIVKILPPRPRRDYERAALSSVSIPIVQRIFRAVSLEFGLSIPEIIAHDRHRQFSVPRFVAIGLMLQLTNMSLPAIGRRLANRDHTTILNGRDRINVLLRSEAFRNRFDQIKASITGAAA